jgi:hypothetical protein
MRKLARLLITHLALLQLMAAEPALAANWVTESSISTWTTYYCSKDGAPSCPITFTTTWTSSKGYFMSQAEAAAACHSRLGVNCGYASGEPGPPHMFAANIPSCTSGDASLCISTLFDSAFAYFPTLVVEQDVERPQDCRSTGRQFGNPIDGLTGEKRETIRLLAWSPDAPALQLTYRSGRFARQVGVQSLAGPSTPVASGQPSRHSGSTTRSAGLGASG